MRQPYVQSKQNLISPNSSLYFSPISRIIITFELSFSCEGELYIVKGYGKQLSPDFSITVNELYLSDNYIVFDTELYGPKQKSTSKAKSYPYIVVKTEYINKSIVFK